MRALNTNPKIWIRLGIALLVMIVCISIMWYLRSFFKYIFLSVALYYIMNPFVLYLQKLGTPKTSSAIIVIATFIIIIIGILAFYIPLVRNEISTISQTWPAIEQRIDQELIQAVRDNTSSIIAYTIPSIRFTIPAANVKAIFTQAQSFASSLASGIIPFILSSLVIVPIITFMLLNEWPKLFRKMLKLIPNKYFEFSVAMFHDIQITLENFINAKGIQSLIVASICSLGFMIIGVKLALLMGLIVGILNIIPYIGPPIGALFPVLSSYLLVDAETSILAFIVVIISQLVDNFITQPILIPRLVKEHPLVVILVTLLGAEAFGAVGMILSLPLFSILKVVIVRSYTALDLTYPKEV